MLTPDCADCSVERQVQAGSNTRRTNLGTTIMTLKTKTELLEELAKLAEAVIQSADCVGCSEDLTVVSREAVNMMEDFIVNYLDSN